METRSLGEEMDTGRKGRILSTPSFLLGCPSCRRTKEMDGEGKREGKKRVTESRSLFSDRCSARDPTGASCPSHVLFLSSHLPFHPFMLPPSSSSSHLCLSCQTCPPPSFFPSLVFVFSVRRRREEGG